MTIFAKIRSGFTVAIGEVLHVESTIVAVTEKEFEAIAHKVEVLAEAVAADLHLTKGHALAVSPALSADKLASPPATETVVSGGAAPTPGAAPAAAEETQAAAETHQVADAPVPAGEAAPTPDAAPAAAEETQAAKA